MNVSLSLSQVAGKKASDGLMIMFLYFIHFLHAKTFCNPHGKAKKDAARAQRVMQRLTIVHDFLMAE